MSRRDVLLEIAQSFEDDFTVSVEPDLPELFEGPDVLAGKPGQLIAVFVPKSHELRHPEQLRTRLVLSRLALPDHAQCVLVLEDSGDVSRLEQLGRDFDAVVVSTDRADLPRLRSESQHHQIPASTRRMVERRTAFLVALSLAHQPRLAAPGNVAEDWDGVDVMLASSTTNGAGDPAQLQLPFWPMPLLTQSARPQAPSASVDVYDGVLVAGSSGAGRSISERIRPYLTVAAQTAFRIDHGVPYLGHPTAGVFIVQDARWPRVDPLKPVRASAFAGWALLSDPSRDEMSESVREASRWLVGTVRERA